MKGSALQHPMLEPRSFAKGGVPFLVFFWEFNSCCLGGEVLLNKLHKCASVTKEMQKITDLVGFYGRR